MSAILDKIAKVLAKAEATDNEHEADAFLAHAQKLATAHAIDLAVARRHVAKSQQREVPVQRTITIGVSRAVGNAKFVSLFLAVAGVNDLTCNIAHNSTYVIAFGFPSDIEVTEALYGHLAMQMVESANAYLRTGAFRDEATWDPRNQTFKPASAKAARIAFYAAFIDRISSRLLQAKQEAEQSVEADRLAAAEDTAAGPVSVGTDLVLADKRAEVKSFYKSESTARGSWRGNRRSTAAPTSARTAGHEAGSKARLSAIPTLPEGKKSIA